MGLFGMKKQDGNFYILDLPSSSNNLDEQNPLFEHCFMYIFILYVVKGAKRNKNLGKRVDYIPSSSEK